jgi:hypothetical protein
MLTTGVVLWAAIVSSDRVVGLFKTKQQAAEVAAVNALQFEANVAGEGGVYPAHPPIADLSLQGHPLPFGAGVNFVKRVEWPGGPADTSAGAAVFARVEIDIAESGDSTMAFDSLIKRTYVLCFSSAEAATAHPVAPGRKPAIGQFEPRPRACKRLVGDRPSASHAGLLR